MAKTIWKYELSVTDEQSVMMPAGAKFLSVDRQGDWLCLWALVDPNKGKVRRGLGIVGTGNPCPYERAQFVGTVQAPPFVWHVFDLGE